MSLNRRNFLFGSAAATALAGCATDKIGTRKLAPGEKRNVAVIGCGIQMRNALIPQFLGQNALGGLVYFTVTGLSDEGRKQLGVGSEAAAALIAMNKDDGKPIWTLGLSSRSESSPIALYDEAGNGWILQCEQNGTIHLLEGLTGREVSSLQVKGEIEASPAAYNNVVVIGTTGKGTSYIYGIEVRLKHAEEGGENDEEDSGGA